MQLRYKQLIWLSMLTWLVVEMMVGCATTVPHQGCDVVDSRLRGKYSGDCRGGKAYGRGKAIGTDVYEGEFVNGIVHGQGTYLWSDGDKYIGQFNNGKAHGRGIMMYRDGRRVEGVWKNNNLVQS